ncbi:NAD(P)H-binding protein [Amycolatopsis rhabdoformis]|uniref:NAD(P)H-binding protein n=1 Tax=Amycolatopsis rhabdoformis TaxID=1448059 RepID=A0ABZ1HYZ6_9PSEU|nr:NAD(P)H-binding protein [Amycolatopsis rhabdoformis]WSE26614.1 NAD(P)H-binding protein [Amycolatopsis rhabdoformis]
MSIVITGATGQLGRLVIADLLAAGVPAGEITAVARSAEKAADLGVRVHVADYNQPDTFQGAFAAGDRVLLVSGTDNGQRVPQHAAVVEAAKAADVAQLAYTGVFGGPAADFTLADDHRATEQLILDSGLPYTFLRNNWYTELAVPDAAGALARGAVVNSVDADGRIATAPREDYAEAAAVVLHTDGHLGAAYELGGDHAWTYGEYAAELARIGGRPVTHKTVSGAEFEAILTGAGVPPFMAAILVDVDAAIGRGRLAGTPGDLAKLIGRPTTPLADTIAKLLA